MKYFRINEPYYALIQAKSFDKAIEIYLEYVSSDSKEEVERHMTEVNKPDALLDCMKSIEMGNSSSEILSSLQFGEDQILLVDKALM